MIGTLLAPLALAWQVAAAPAPAAPIIVHLADGSNLPLRGWTLSYEYLMWPKDGPPAAARTRRRDSSELLVGKRRLPMPGVTLELAARPGERPRLLLAGADGGRSELRLEPPSRALLAPEAAADVSLAARSLDLHGESLTGTRRSFCVASYSALVQCGGDPAFTVVKIEFPR